MQIAGRVTIGLTTERGTYSSDKGGTLTSDEVPGGGVTFRTEDGDERLRLTVRATIVADGLVMNVSVHNEGPAPVHLRYVRPFVCDPASGGRFRCWKSIDDVVVLTDSWERCYGEAGPHRLVHGTDIKSAWDLHCFDRAAGKSCSMSYYGIPTSKLSFRICRDMGNSAAMEILADTHSGARGVLIEPGDVFQAGDLIFLNSTHDPFDALETYARRIAEHNRVSRPTVIPVGWVDWYFAKGATTEDDLLRNLDFIARELKEFGLEYIQIDSGWQLGVETTPPPHNVIAGGPWIPNSKFPRGMKWYADRIRERGLRPGIWIRPFHMIEGAEERSAHPDWFNERGQMDFSHPEVREHVRRLCSLLVDDWGYEYVKFDFPSFDLFNAWGPALFEEHAARQELQAGTKTNIQAYRESMEVMREATRGKASLLACNSIMPATLGCADVFRIGDDVGDWHRTFTYGVKSVSARYYTNGIFWTNDPDCLLVREPFTIDQARMWATLVGLSSGAVFISEKLHELPAERLAIIRKAMPVYRNAGNHPPGRPLDLLDAAVPELWHLRVVRDFMGWDLVGVFNWGEETSVHTIHFDRLGPDRGGACMLYEFWSDRFIGVRRGPDVVTVPPLSCTLLSIHPVRPHPQFVSSDRHLTQGGVDLLGCRWSENMLRGTNLLVGGHATIVTIHVPAGYAMQSVEGGSLVSDDEPEIIRLRLTSDRSSPCEWRVKFTVQ